MHTESFDRRFVSTLRPFVAIASMIAIYATRLSAEDAAIGAEKCASEHFVVSLWSIPVIRSQPVPGCDSKL